MCFPCLAVDVQVVFWLLAHLQSEDSSCLEQTETPQAEESCEPPSRPSNNSYADGGITVGGSDCARRMIDRCDSNGVHTLI